LKYATLMCNDYWTFILSTDQPICIGGVNPAAGIMIIVLDQ
jgi:hypothetical protein